MVVSKSQKELLSIRFQFLNFSLSEVLLPLWPSSLDLPVQIFSRSKHSYKDKKELVQYWSRIESEAVFEIEVTIYLCNL